MKLKSFITSGAILGMMALTACGGGTGGTNHSTHSDASSAAKPAAAEPAKKTDYPSKPVTLLVPFAAGGGTDTISRHLVKVAEKHLGQPIVIVNKTGGGGSVGMTEGANAKPDGYTITMVTGELTMLHHLGTTRINYKQYKPVAQFNDDPLALSVKADAPWKTAKEFLEYAKQKKGDVKIGNSGTGGIHHVNAASIEQAAGVEFTHLPLDGTAGALTNVLGGHIDAVLVSPPEAKALVDSGKLKSLAILDARESEVFPGVKTFEADTGIKAQYYSTWRGVAVPKDTPDEIVKVLAEAFKKASEEQEFKDFMKKSGYRLVYREGPEFGKFMQESDDNFGRAFKTLGLSK